MKDSRMPQRRVRFAGVVGATSLALGVLMFAPEKASAQQSANSTDSAASSQAPQSSTPKRRARRAQKCFNIPMPGFPGALQACPGSDGQPGPVNMGGDSTTAHAPSTDSSSAAADTTAAEKPKE